jgi:dTDP-4-amino-4,6-dideoxygalactose transaminase
MAQYSIPYVQVNTQYNAERTELMAVIDRALSEHSHVGDALVETLETEFAAYCGVKHALNSGTDALMLGMVALGIRRGDEVITPPNSFVASTATIAHIGATPVFADVLPDQNIDPEAVARAITPRTKAIMAVHLTGRVCRMDALRALADKHNLLIIEDAAQSVGSKYDGNMSGSKGDLGCFSTHPLKNLNACGDGGFVTTNNPDIASYIRRQRAHGMSDRVTVEEWGFVSRMDTVQAAILRYRLTQLPEVIAKRRANAAYYQANLKHPDVFIPPCQPQEFNTFHTFVIQVPHRDALQAHLASLGIKTTIHYPVPIHLQPAAKKLGHSMGDFPVTESQAQRILTLPVNQFMSRSDQDSIIREVTAFLDQAANAKRSA